MPEISGFRSPVALQSLRWFREPTEMLERGRNRFGDTFMMRIAHEGTWAFVSHPDDVKRVFTADPKQMHAGEGNEILGPVLGRSSVLLLDEDRHMEQRKLMLPHFHGERMTRYTALMSEVAREEIGRWPLDRSLRARPRMQALTFEIIMRAVFGVGGGDRQGELRERLAALLELISSPRGFALTMALGPKRVAGFSPFRKAIERIDTLLISEISERRSAGDLEGRVDILSLLVQAAHDDGSPMTDREVRDELMTLLVAGHETTATALSWALERLTRNPDKLARLVAEVDVGHEEYLDAVVKETLRLRPVILLVLRKLTSAFELADGRVLPAGAKVVPAIYLMHRRPDVYPEPDRFLPERFLERPPDTYTWIPFGGGVRRCLGGAFAELEMRIVLRELLATRRIAPGGERPEPMRRRSITNVPADGARIRVAAR